MIQKSLFEGFRNRHSSKEPNVLPPPKLPYLNPWHKNWVVAPTGNWGWRWPFVAPKRLFPILANAQNITSATNLTWLLQVHRTCVHPISASEKASLGPSKLGFPCFDRGGRPDLSDQAEGSPRVGTLCCERYQATTPKYYIKNLLLLIFSASSLRIKSHTCILLPAWLHPWEPKNQPNNLGFG